MRKLNVCLTLVAAVSAITTVGPSAAASPSPAPAEDTVTVFSTEFTEVTVYRDPNGCIKLPVDAHVLVNQTQSPVTTYGDPFCMTPGLTVQPGYGSHVAPGTGSFSADS